MDVCVYVWDQVSGCKPGAAVRLRSCPHREFQQFSMWIVYSWPQVKKKQSHTHRPHLKIILSTCNHISKLPDNVKCTQNQEVPHNPWEWVILLHSFTISVATAVMVQWKGESSVWTDNGAGLYWTITLEYKVYKIQENAIWLLLFSMYGRENTFSQTHVKSPARKIKTSTSLVMSTIYVLLVRR